MKYTPYEYQNFATQKIIDLPESGLFLDMGLGKTVSTLTAIKELYRLNKIARVLVIAPKKVAETVWTDEIDKWDHLNGITTSKILGTEKKRKLALQQKADIYIINRENIVWLVSLLGSNWNFDMVVIDELSSFKSPKSQRFKAMKLIRKYVNRIVGLTGTPAPNGLLDLWSQLYLLDQGQRLGETFPKYRDTYFNAGQRDGYVVYNYNLKKGNALLGEDCYKKEIYDSISDICFSMKTEDYRDLPERLDLNRYIDLPPKIMQQYYDFEEAQVLELFGDGQEISAVNSAVLSNKLLQFANGAIYDDNRTWHTVHNEKLDAVKEVYEELQGKPLLIFYAYLHDKERLLTTFKKARLLQTPQDIKDWNAGKIPMLVCHPASAGHGLNLQFGGQNMLHYGLTWSLELYEQAIKRIHRNGVAGAVTNTRLLARNTMDEDVLNRLQGKGRTQNALMGAVKARIEKYLK